MSLKKLIFNKTVVFDFDGVIHSFTSGWHEGQKDTQIFDPPTNGIRETIKKLRDNGWSVVVVSARCSTLFGRIAIKRWLKKYDIEVDGISRDKVPAHCYIDDRTICFEGDTSTLYDSIVKFKSWIDYEE